MADPFADALILTGPTASGKSALALELAPRLNAEIIALDSMTLYRGMDVGTAKPTKEDRQRIPHHLVDVLEPWESANVAWWLEKAAAACRDITARGKQPLFVGGTPFYLKALMHGLFPSPPASAEVRARLEFEASAKGKARLHARLALVDPVTAARLHLNDVRRVVRALEVWEITGKPISDWQQQGWWDAPKPVSETPPAEPPPCVVITLRRGELYERINRRVEMMVRGGWIEEVQRLRALPRPLSKEAGQALGYLEIAEYLEGKRSLEETLALIQTRTRQFAKRQLTWFRRLDGCKACEGKLTFEVWAKRMSSPA